MHVGGVAHIRRKGGASAHGAANAHNSHPQLPATPMPPAPAPLPAQTISIAGGDWPVDTYRAHHDAKLLLDGIDWTKRDIVVWVPGTSNHTIHRGFETAVREGWLNADVSLNRMEYEASWNMRPSTATGVETLRLILAGIAAQGGNHRVLLAGESQGAWIIGEAMADPMLKHVVDRAVLLGHPFLAKHHYEDGKDPRVIEINHRHDQVSQEVKGDPAKALDAMVAIHQMQIGKIGTVLGALAANPFHGVLLLGTGMRALLPKGWIVDPHDYTGDMPRVVEFLQFGNMRIAPGSKPEDAEAAALSRAQHALAIAA